MVNLMNIQNQETRIAASTTWSDRSPVPDGIYVATLRPPIFVPFVDTVFDRGRGQRYTRINLDAIDLRRIDDDVSCAGIAYGNLKSRSRWLSTSSLTTFLKRFGLYVPGSSTSQRVDAAKAFIQSQPKVVVVTRWIGYSKRPRRTVARCMSQFPSLGDGLYEPTLILEDGEVIRAKARITAYYAVETYGNTDSFCRNPGGEVRQMS
jgi:hypothetical protein